MRTGGDENIHGKEANCFYLMVPKLDNLKNQQLEKSEIIIHLAKKNYDRIKKRQLKKSKIETKTASKNKETTKKKNVQKKKLMFSDKN